MPVGARTTTDARAGRRPGRSCPSPRRAAERRETGAPRRRTSVVRAALPALRCGPAPRPPAGRRVRSSGPQTSTTRPGAPGHRALRRPDPGDVPHGDERDRVPPRPDDRPAQDLARSARNAALRTPHHPAPAERRCCSAACLARNSDVGASAAAPTTDSSTTVAPSSAAAQTRLRFPSRSTDHGVTRPGRGNRAPPTPRPPSATAARRAGVADVAAHDLHRWTGQVCGTRRLAGQHPHPLAPPVRSRTGAVPSRPLPPATRITGPPGRARPGPHRWARRRRAPGRTAPTRRGARRLRSSAPARVAQHDDAAQVVGAAVGPGPDHLPLRPHPEPSTADRNPRPAGRGRPRGSAASCAVPARAR